MLIHTTGTCLLFLSKTNNKTVYCLKDDSGQLKESEIQTIDIASSQLTGNTWLLIDKATENLLEKIRKQSLELLDLPSDISRGSSSGNDEIFTLKKKGNLFYTKEGEQIEVEKSILRIAVYSTDFGRYLFKDNMEDFIIFPYTVLKDSYEIIPEKVLKNNYPKAYKYLTNNKNALLKRKQFKDWFGYSAPRNLNLHQKAEILIPLLANKGMFSPAPKKSDKYTLMASGGFSVSVQNNSYHPKFILGLINSTLLFWILKLMSNKFRGGWITCTKQYFGKLPIRKLDFSNKTETATHDKIVRLVDQIMEAKKKLNTATSDRDKDYYLRRARSIDREINREVYKLYGLSKEEIGIIEDKNN